MSGISKQASQQIDRLVADGMNRQDAHILRRQAMTLQRWFELECSDSNDHGAWAIVRGHKNGSGFEHDDDGRPYLEHHHYLHGRGQDYVTHSSIPDREKGARNRIQKMLSNYPSWGFYIQTDPRGAALYVLRPDQLTGEPLDQIYTRGVALFK